MALKIDPQTNERVYELICIEDGCMTKGGEIRFPEQHGRESDEAMERELDERYVHRCDEHS